MEGRLGVPKGEDDFGIIGDCIFLSSEVVGTDVPGLGGEEKFGLCLILRETSTRVVGSTGVRIATFSISFCDAVRAAARTSGDLSNCAAFSR